MIEIYDLNDCPLSFKNGSYGGMAGSKDGILINGESWIVKYPKNLFEMHGKGIASYSTSPLSEYIGSHVYQILGYNVHNTILGERNEKLVVACKDFAIDGLLLEIRTIKNHTGKNLSDLLDHSPLASSDTHVVDLDELLLHIRKNPVLSNIKNLENHFFEQSLIDIFIGNNDRNNGNWGILRRHNKPDEIAPVFDNGGSFLTKASEIKVSNLLHSGELRNNAINVLTAYGIDGHHYSAIRFLDKMKNEPKMQTAVLKIVPLIEKKLPEIYKLISDLPTVYITKFGKTLNVCSKERGELYSKQLEIRYKEILYPFYEKTKEQMEKESGINDLEENEPEI